MAVTGRNAQVPGSRFQVPPLNITRWSGRGGGGGWKGNAQLASHCHHDRKAHTHLGESTKEHEPTLIHGSKWAGCTYQAGIAVFCATISIACMMTSDVDMEVIAPPVAKDGETRDQVSMGFGEGKKGRLPRPSYQLRG
jgi:hypothetical protein